MYSKLSHRLLLVATVGSVVVAGVPPAGDLPIPQSDLAMASDGHYAYAFLQKTTSQLDPSTGKWTPVGNGIGVTTAAAAGDASSIVIVGSGGQEPGANCTIFYPSSFKSTFCPNVPTPRGYLAAAIGSDGKVYAIGGFAPPGWNVVEALDRSTMTWDTSLPPLPTPRYGLAAASLNGKIYTVGGAAWHVPASDALEIFDTTTQQWSSGPSLPTPRAFLSAAAFNGKIYVFGGEDENGNKLDVVEVYDPATNTWAPDTPLKEPRAHLAAAATADYVIAAGGIEGSGWNEHPASDVDTYFS